MNIVKVDCNDKAEKRNFSYFAHPNRILLQTKIRKDVRNGK